MDISTRQSLVDQLVAQRTSAKKSLMCGGDWMKAKSDASDVYKDAVGILTLHYAHYSKDQLEIVYECLADAMDTLHTYWIFRYERTQSYWKKWWYAQHCKAYYMEARAWTRKTNRFGEPSGFRQLSRRHHKYF